MAVNQKRLAIRTMASVFFIHIPHLICQSCFEKLCGGIFTPMFWGKIMVSSINILYNLLVAIENDAITYLKEL
jgi:hypothetical protein